MARGVNKVILIGNLGKDPEVRYFQNGDAVANATLATTETWKDKQTGETREATEWHNVVFPGKLGEIAGKYLKKGSKVYVEGSLRTRKWQDKDGRDRYTTEIRVSDMQMLDSRPGGTAPMGDYGEDGGTGSRVAPAPRHGGGERADRPERAAPPPTIDHGFEDDDIPF